MIDGRIGDAEWATATHERLERGGDVFLLKQDDFLYVAVRGPGQGLASLCVAEDRVVRILHASAAVGEARYVRAGEQWSRQKGFEWSLRDLPDRSATEIDNARFLTANGWLANASRSGSRDREFKIRNVNITALGVTFLSADEPMIVSYWPATLDDDCRAPQILKGYLPDVAHFRLAGWHALSR